MQTITRYQKRICVPMLDRIDTAKPYRGAARGLRKAARCSIGRTFSKAANQRGTPSHNGITCNADMRPAQIRQYCQLDETSNSLKRTAMNQIQLLGSIGTLGMV